MSNAQNGFDVGELEASDSRWSNKINAYEIQTNALTSELEKCSVLSAWSSRNLASLAIVTNAIEIKKTVEKEYDI
jgi:hypothetical protein